jgi:hypothetical protein
MVLHTPLLKSGRPAQKISKISSNGAGESLQSWMARSSIIADRAEGARHLHEVLG